MSSAKDYVEQQVSITIALSQILPAIKRHNGVVSKDISARKVKVQLQGGSAATWDLVGADGVKIPVVVRGVTRIFPIANDLLIFNEAEFEIEPRWEIKTESDEESIKDINHEILQAFGMRTVRVRLPRPAIFPKPFPPGVEGVECLKCHDGWLVLAPVFLDEFLQFAERLEAVVEEAKKYGNPPWKLESPQDLEYIAKWRLIQEGALKPLTEGEVARLASKHKLPFTKIGAPNSFQVEYWHPTHKLRRILPFFTLYGILKAISPSPVPEHTKNLCIPIARGKVNIHATGGLAFFATVEIPSLYESEALEPRQVDFIDELAERTGLGRSYTVPFNLTQPLIYVGVYPPDSKVSCSCGDLEDLSAQELGRWVWSHKIEEIYLRYKEFIEKVRNASLLYKF